MGLLPCSRPIRSVSPCSRRPGCQGKDSLSSCTRASGRVARHRRRPDVPRRYPPCRERASHNRPSYARRTGFRFCERRNVKLRNTSQKCPRISRHRRRIRHQCTLATTGHRQATKPLPGTLSAASCQNRRLPRARAVSCDTYQDHTRNIDVTPSRLVPMATPRRKPRGTPWPVPFSRAHSRRPPSHFGVVRPGPSRSMLARQYEWTDSVAPGCAREGHTVTSAFRRITWTVLAWATSTRTASRSLRLRRPARRSTDTAVASETAWQFASPVRIGTVRRQPQRSEIRWPTKSRGNRGA